jgi:hypothetical protein
MSKHGVTLCGDGSNMPPQLKEATAHMRHKVLYWSATDQTQPIQRGMCCTAAGPLIALPCFWPHLLILGLPLCCMAWLNKQDVLARYIVVTESTVEVVEVEHDKCCIPGCYRKGNEINSIPLETITDVETDAKSKGCVTCCVPQFTQLRIMTPSNQMVRRGVTPGLAVYAHSDVQELRNHILNQRTTAKQGGMVQMMQRDSGQEVAEKLTALKNMLESGLINQSEHDKKKSDILGNM